MGSSATSGYIGRDKDQNRYDVPYGLYYEIE